jgi:F-type H+-transporting ATPase subunit beta
MNKGKIVQVVGPVVDIEFTELLPAIYNALTVEFKVDSEPFKLTLEVQQHLGDHWVRTVSMSGPKVLSVAMRSSTPAHPFPCPSGKG